MAGMEKRAEEVSAYIEEIQNEVLEAIEEHEEEA